MKLWRQRPGGGNPATRYFLALLVAVFGFVQHPSVVAQAVADNDSQDAGQQTVRGAESPGGPALDSVTEAEGATEYVGEMYQIGLGWHPAALEGLPTDKFGLVDWVAALEQGMIKPRGAIEPDAPEAVPFDMNIVMPSKTGMIAGAYFPHKTHTTWMSCDSCHIKIFMPLAGSNDLTMSTIVKGQACGVCHGKVAFPLNDCARCHISHEAGADAGAAEQ